VVPLRQCHPATLAAWADPDWVIVSGEEDRRGTLRRLYQTVGGTVLRTTVDGAATIEVLLDGQLKVGSYREFHPSESNRATISAGH
jgi:hypothetical protein